MIFKKWINRKKKLNIQDRQLPTSFTQLLQQYDLDNNDVYKDMGNLVDDINSEFKDKVSFKVIDEWED